MRLHARTVLRQATALGVATLLTVTGFAVLSAEPAAADTAPAPGTPATVTADALPTWQVNGVAWSQAIVGNTVYVTGNFATARPPGVSAGGAGEISVGNLFAYDIRTGNPVAFNHVLNGQGLVVHATADGSRLYVGGDFTAVDGQPRSHLAAFDLATGALVPSFAPTFDGTVKAIATTGQWVYVGGAFFHVGDVYRQRLAALSPVNGGLSSTWAPRASTSDVRSMVMAPDQSKVIIGGSFLTLSDVTANGMGAVDPVDGSVLPWAANQLIKDYDNGGITSLTTDGTSVFGSGFAFGTGGTFEGSFSLNPADGSIQWIADCLGDAYSTYPDVEVVYSVGHAHNCSNIGGFPDTNPRVRWQRAMATTKAPTQTIGQPDAYGWNFTGQAAPSLLHWYPGLEDGTASGQNQAAWSVAGTGAYIALAGEFPIVNNAYQQGLTRFAKSASAPNLARPRFDVNPPKVVPTTATAIRPNTVRLTYGSAWDRDNEELTYDVFRDSTIVSTTKLKTNFWTTPQVGFTDTNVPSGDHTYKVRVSDPFGNTNYTTPSNTVSVSATVSTFATAVLTDNPSAYWRLNDGTGSTAVDYTGNGNDATARAGVTFGSAGASGDGGTAVDLSGTSTGILYATPPGAAPDTFSVETWFKTTTTKGGKLIGFGNKTDGTSTTVDRHIYMDNTGHLFFGVYPGTAKVVSSPGAYNDGQWHQVVATLGADGQRLYVDGAFVARNVSVTSATSGLVGQWVLGGDTIAGWPSAPTSRYFAGSLDEAAVYPAVLTPTQIQAHFTASGRAVRGVPAPTDAYGTAVVASNPSSYWRLDEATAMTAADASGHGDTGLYVGTVTRSQPGAAPTGSSVTTNGTSSYLASSFNLAGPTAYSAEVWFKTTTTKGGKLIGFGDKQTGNSTVIDRNLTMLNSGALRLSINNNTAVVDSPGTYRDGAWHHAVVTQGSAGMALVVDGVQVGSNPATATRAFVGFWRVGDDVTWGGSSSSYFAGSLDEFATYPSALSLADIRTHYRSSGRTLANAAPVASFTSTAQGRTYTFDGSASHDDDGPLAASSWSFGDGGTATGLTVQHQFVKAGTYTVTLTVTDGQGATASKTDTVTVTNTAPVAAFTPTVGGKTVAVDASASSDPDGTPLTYGWSFGDGQSGTGVTANHLYANAGTFPVTLTVTDGDGSTATSTQTVAVSNQAPTAAVTVTTSDLTVNVDGSGSSDVDGNVTGYAWDFGDGGTATGATASHTYAAAGSFTVTLRVTDNDGATGTATKPVTVRSANQLPVAAFTATNPSDFVGAFDGNGSSDPDGSVVAWSWAFGDGQTGTGATASHTYAASGSYQVTLTVTDDRGGTATTTRTVGVSGPFASDTFSRTVASGWGMANVGGSWTLQGGASTFGVANGVGQMKSVPTGAGVAVQLPGVSSIDTDLTAQMSTSLVANGGGQYLYVTGRGTFSDAYRAKIQVTATGAIVLALTKVVSNTETVISSKTISGLTVAAGTSYSFRMQATGVSPTTLRARVWASTDPEPLDWALVATDTTASLQSPGAIGLRTYVSGTNTLGPVTYSFDSLVARATTN